MFACGFKSGSYFARRSKFQVASNDYSSVECIYIFGRVTKNGSSLDLKQFFTIGDYVVALGCPFTCLFLQLHFHI